MADQQKSSLFREKNMEAINSPEKLDHYLHVTNPGIWAVLGAVILLMIGVCVWGIVGRLETYTQVAVCYEDGQGICYVPEDSLDNAVKYKYILIDGEKYSLDPDVPEPEVVTSSMNVYLLLAGNLKEGDVVYEIPITETLPDEIYTGDLINESISPFSLLFN